MGSPPIVLENTSDREGEILFTPRLQRGVSPEHVILPNHYVADIEKVWISHGIVLDRIEKLAVDIRKASKSFKSFLTAENNCNPRYYLSRLMIEGQVAYT